MPGGGGIGGSCRVWFQVHGHNKHDDSDPAVGEKDRYMVTFTFPDGKKTTVPMGPGDVITYDWR